jgi:hypothetical protein
MILQARSCVLINDILNKLIQLVGPWSFEPDLFIYLKYFPFIMRQVAQFLQLNLVRLPLVQVGKGLFVLFGGDRRRRCQHVLEPAVYETSRYSS